MLCGFVDQGEVIAGWAFEREERHPEYVRYYFRSGDATTGVEIQASEEAAASNTSPWTTGRHRLMPAPSEQPPRDLLVALMDRLRAHDAAGKPPLVGKPPTRGSAKPAPLHDANRPNTTPLWICLALGLGLGLAHGGARRWPPLAKQLARARASMERFPWPWLAVVLIAMVVARLPLDAPFDVDAMTQRIFYSSLDLGDVLLHRYPDQRHPPLFYAIVHCFLWLGHGEAIARAPALLFSLASAVALFLLARRALGSYRALWATLLLALNMAFVVHGRDVSNVTLFTCLALTSSYLLLRVLDDPTPRRALAFGLCEAAMLYAYYLAPLIVMAHALALVLARRPTKRAWLSIAGAAVVATPVLYKLFWLVSDDSGMRDLAGKYPGHHWGDISSGALLSELSSIVAPGSIDAGSIDPGSITGGAAVLLVMLLAAVAGLFRIEDRALAWLTALIIAIAVPAIAVAVVLVRIKPYYLLFTLPFLLLLVVAGMLGSKKRPPANERLSSIGVGVLGFIVAAYGLAIERPPPPHRDFRALGDAIKSHEGTRVVVADPNPLHTMLLYYAFDDPLPMYRSCRLDVPTAGTHCRRGDDRLVTLTSLPEMDEGWEQRAVELLDRVQRATPTWVVYSALFENELLLQRLQSRCELADRFGRFADLSLFRCPAT